MQEIGGNDIHAIEFTPYPNGKGLEGSADAGVLRTERQEPDAGYPARFLCPSWEEFPTQSPICRRNDGFSGKLDGITFYKWREESIKAYGNAIVTQVAYEIFKDIQGTYYKPKNILWNLNNRNNGKEI